MRLTGNDVPGTVELPARSVRSFISVLLISALSLKRLERLSDQFFTLLPERLSIVWIKRIRAYTFADDGDGRGIRHDSAHVAIFAVLPPDLIGRSNDSGPHR